MTDFSTLRLKINDLKAKVEHNSISPVYLGAILDEFLAALAAVDANTLNPNLLNDIRRSLDDLDEMVNTNASSINTIRGSIGVPSGIAPLGPDGKVPSANLRASVGGESVREIIEFHSVVSGVEAADSCAWSSTGAACHVVYDSDTDSFLLARNQIIKSQSSAVDDVIDVDLSGGETPLNPEITIRTSYYRMWTDAGSFGTISGGAVKPVSGRIYVCTSDNTIYTCKSSALVLSGGNTAGIPADLIDTIQTKIDYLNEQRRARTIRAGFPRTGMKPHFAYKPKMIITDEGYYRNEYFVRKQYPAVVVSGFRNVDPAESVNLDTAFPGGLFMGEPIDFYDPNGNAFTYDRDTNTVSKSGDYSGTNACFVILKKAQLKGKYLSTDDSGQVIAVDATYCREEVLTPLRAQDIEVASISRYLIPIECEEVYVYKSDPKYPFIVRPRTRAVSNPNPSARAKLEYGRPFHLEWQVKKTRLSKRKNTGRDIRVRRYRTWRSKASLGKCMGTFRARAVTRSAKSEWRYFSFWIEDPDIPNIKAHIHEIHIDDRERPIRGEEGAYSGKWRYKATLKGYKD